MTLTIKTDTESGESHGQVIADIVDVLLGRHELVESDDTITAQETVVGSGVQTWARPSESTWWWVLVLMSRISGGRYLNIADLTSGESIDFRATVWVLACCEVSVYWSSLKQ